MPDLLTWHLESSNIKQSGSISRSTSCVSRYDHSPIICKFLNAQHGRATASMQGTKIYHTRTELNTTNDRGVEGKSNDFVVAKRSPNKVP